MQITAEYTESLVKRATMRYWSRLIGWHGFAAIALVSGLVIFFLVTADYSWHLAVMSTLLFLAVVSAASVYLVQRHRALSTLRRMPEPKATIGFTDAGVSTRSGLGGGHIAWAVVTRVWTFPEVWLLFVAKGIYITIPVISLSDDIQEFVKKKVREHGGRIA